MPQICGFLEYFSFSRIFVVPVAFRLKTKFINFCTKFWIKQVKFLLSRCTILLLCSKPVRQNCLRFFKTFKKQCALQGLNLMHGRVKSQRVSYICISITREAMSQDCYQKPISWHIKLCAFSIIVNCRFCMKRYRMKTQTTYHHFHNSFHKIQIGNYTLFCYLSIYRFHCSSIGLRRNVPTNQLLH